MVKRRAFSSSDEYTSASSQRKNKILSPRTPKAMLKHQQFFDFSKITTATTATKATIATPKRRSVSWSGFEDELSTSANFRRVCRKYTITGEIAEQLAKIGDEIMHDYESMLKELNVISLYQFFNVAIGLKRRMTVSPQQHQQQRAEKSRRCKISGYLGILLIHFIKNF